MVTTGTAGSRERITRMPFLSEYFSIGITGCAACKTAQSKIRIVKMYFMVFSVAANGFLKFLRGQGIEHVVRSQPAPASGQHAIPHIMQVFGVVGVSRNGEL